MATRFRVQVDLSDDELAELRAITKATGVPIEIYLRLGAKLVAEDYRQQREQASMMTPQELAAWGA